MSSTLHLHIGAHRTGTTSLQNIARANASDLEFHGVRVLLPPRHGGNDRESIRPFLRDALKINPKDTLRKRLRSFRYRLALNRQLDSNSKLIVISDENILTSRTIHVLTRGFYGEAEPRLEKLRSGLRLTPSKVFVGIRDYASFHESLYAEIARYHVLPVANDVRCGAIGRLLSGGEGWVPLLSSVRKVFPDAIIEVWPQEDMNPAARFQRLTGVDDSSPVSCVKENASPGIAAIEALQEIRKQMKITHELAEEIVARHSKRGDSKLCLFDEQERKELIAKYRADLRELKKMGFSLNEI